jgi:hypothetical protein
MDTLLDYDALASQGKALAEKYRSAKPFPHIAVDGLLVDKKLKAAVADFPKTDDPRWFDCETPGSPHLKRKNAIWDVRKIPDSLAKLIFELNSEPFVEFLQAMTGIQNLVGDPHLFGAGLHMSLTGGRLGIHADHNLNPKMKLFRRVSVLLYLNEGWKDEWGGHLEMWSSDMKRCEDKIAPKFGRFAVFTNSETSFHGHPEPMKCPKDVSRKSIASYYYSNEPHPSYKAGDEHRAVFHARPGETFEKGAPSGY